MYYSFPYSLNDFIENYEEQLKTEENGFSAKDESILDFTNIIKMLFISDSDNFLNIINQLIENYRMTLIDSESINKEDKEMLEMLKLPIVDLANVLYYNDLYIQILLEKYLMFQKEYTKEKQEEIKKEYSLKKQKRF